MIGYGVFMKLTMPSWLKLKFSALLIDFDKIVENVNTETAECQGQDMIVLNNLINVRGGFDRLKEVVRKVREEGKKVYSQHTCSMKCLL